MSGRDPFSSFIGDNCQVEAASLFDTVLLIQAESPSNAGLKLLLEQLTGMVNRAGSAEEALAQLESSFYELALCDLSLPDLSGVTLINAMHALRPSLPLIVLADVAQLEQVAEAMQEGAWDYVLKGSGDNLRKRLETVIQRVAERRLQEMRSITGGVERSAFWAAVHTAADGLAIMGADGGVAFANTTFQDFCEAAAPGVSPGAGLNVVNLIEAVDREVAAALGQQLAKGQQGSRLIWQSELRLAGGASAAPRFFELSLSSVGFGRDDDQAVIAVPGLCRFVMWVREITVRKEQERFQRDLLSTTTHDLKGPIGSILKGAELLEDFECMAAGDVRRLLTSISACARNSITLIDQLLSARRIQEGCLAVERRWCDLKAICEEVQADFKPSADSRRIELSAAGCPADLKVFADRLGLTRVLSNLVSNGIKFTPSGGRVAIAAEDRGHEVLIKVADTGSGIKGQGQAKLFDRFSRLPQHQQIEGTGLGLFIVKSIVDAHEGRIIVESQEQIGTTFTIFLPKEPSA